MSEQKGFSTKVLHVKSNKKDPHGSIRFPIYDNVAFESSSAEDHEDFFKGKKQGHVYSRITNPTVEDFELKIKIVSNAFSVLALSSGMAAISNIFLTVAKSGDNIITSRHLFGNTYSLFEQTLKPWGFCAKYADLTNLSEVERLIDENTRAIYFETITNPQLEIVDITGLSNIAKKHNLLLISDTTLTPFSRFISSLVNIEVVSSTKIISGGATSVGGLIIDYGNYNWSYNPKLAESYKAMGPFALIAKLRKEVYRNLGACLSPHNAYLQALGLETFSLRWEKACKNTLDVALFLSKHPKIKSVNYPGLSQNKYFDLATKQFGNGGSILTFNLSSKEACFSFLNRLNVIRRATNLQDNRTLAINPSSTIFVEYDAKTKEDMGVFDELIRLSVGIEESEDIISDILQALGG